MNIIQQMNQMAVQPGCLAVWGLGQMGFAFKGNSPEILYIDPVLSDVVAIKFPEQAGLMSRSFPPPVEPGDITNATWVLCTHEHIDHADPLTLGPLMQASPDAKVIASGWCDGMLEEAGIPHHRRVRPKMGTTLQLGAFSVTPIPAAHYGMDHDEHLGYRFLSYIIEISGVRVLHSGDTLMHPEWVLALKEQPRVDVAILAVNGRDPFREEMDILGNLTPEEAVWLGEKLGWDVIIQGHNDLFPFNTIAPGLFADAVRHYNPRQKFHSLQPGELFYYVRP